MLRRKVQVFVYRHKPGLEVLLLKRTRASKEGVADDWAPVTGNVDAHENLRAAAVRECLEELSLALEPEPLALTFTYEKKGKRFHETVYAARAAPDEEPDLSEEHSSMQWVALDKARELLHWPEQRKALDALSARFS